MNDCFITTLNGVVDNPNLVKVGEIRIHVKANSAASANSQELYLASLGTIQVRAEGGGYFGTAYATVDSEHLTNLTITSSQRKIFVANMDFDLVITNKYAIDRFQTQTTKSSISVDLNDLAYSDVKLLRVVSDDSFGDISFLKHSSILQEAYIEANDAIYGDIAAFAGKTTLTRISVYGSQRIVGNLSSIAGCSALTTFQVQNTGVIGNVSSIPSTVASLNIQNTGISGNLNGLPKNAITVYAKNSLVSGSISGMTGYSKLSRIEFPAGVTGELETFAQNLVAASHADGTVTVVFSDYTVTNGGSPITKLTFSITIRGSSYTIS